MKNSTTKFRFTEKTLEIFSTSGVDPKSYMGDKTGLGIPMRNFGSEVKIVGRTKFAAFEKPSELISTGVKLVIPDGYCATFCEKPEITSSPLAVRRVFFNCNFREEIKVSFFNLGEKDIIIPFGARLPIDLVIFPYNQSIEIVSDLEYLEAIS